MDTRFYALIDAALSEVARREPGYLAQFPVDFPLVSDAAKLYALQSQFSLPEAEIGKALADGIAYLRSSGLVSSNADGAPEDPLGRLLADSMVDALAADRGAVPLIPFGGDGRPFPEILASDYTENRPRDGLRYFLRNHGTRPLILINACGIPLAVWSKFLGDPEHDFRIMIVESRGHDMIGGGLHQECDLASDATGILEAMDHAGLENTGILAWCDGGRLAIDLARRRPRQIGALVLLSVSLRGTKALDPPATPYEASFSKVMTTLWERPALAPMLAKMLGEQLPTTDWDGFGTDIEGRVSALCRLPARSHEPLIRVPLSRDLFLLNHGKRIRSDAAFAVDDAIRALDLPLLMITGDRDHIANGAVTRSALGGAARRGIHARIKGAGHYSFDLQYAYFRLLLTEFLINGERPQAMARIEVEDL